MLQFASRCFQTFVLTFISPTLQHIKDPKHQEYAKNSDNFSDLDKIIELTRRRYKVEYSSSKVEERSEVIDGPLPERQAQESQEPEPSSSFVVDDSWEKFADIVW